VKILDFYLPYATNYIILLANKFIDKNRFLGLVGLISNLNSDYYSTVFS
jgi:hypothetical protein